MDNEREVAVTVRAAFNQHHLCMQYKVFATRESSKIETPLQDSVSIVGVTTELVGSETFATPVSVAILPEWLSADLMVLMMRKHHIAGIGEWYNNIDVYDLGDATHRAWVGPKLITYLQLTDLSRRPLWHYATAYKRLTDQQRYERLTDTIKVSSSKTWCTVPTP